MTCGLYAAADNMPEITIKEQLKQSEAIDLDHVSYEVSDNMCSCKFKFSMCLPCKHIFSYRKKNNLPIFEENLYDERWTRKYFFRNLNLIKDNSAMFCEAATSSTKVTVVEQSTKTLTTQEKYRKAVLLTNKLASITAEKSRAIFEKRMEILENISKLWSEGKEIVIAEIAQTPTVPSSVHIVPQMPCVSTDIVTTSLVSPIPISHNIQREEENAGEANSNICQGNLIKNIKMPSKVHVRGRPKGATLTVIGLPKKKGNKMVSNCQ